MNLVKSAMTVGGMTLASRVLGFMRDILIAGALGTGPMADAFFVAFKFPNLFRRLFAEGAFNSAFVPLFAKALEGDGKTAARRFAEDSLSVLLVTLIAFTAIAELTMPWAMYLIAPGFADTPEKFEMGVLFTRIAFPYLMFMSMVALLSAVLNSLGRFTAAAAAPILLNLILISALWFVAPLTDNPGLVLSWGVAISGAAQFVMLLIAVKRADIPLHLRMPRMTPGVRRLIKLGIPGVIAGGITQFNLLVGSIIASLQDGAVSLLYYADRIYQLPLGVVGIAIGIVLLPDLSRRLRAGDETGADNAQNRAFEFSMFLTVPASVALAVIPIPIIQVLFERGAFSSDDTYGTAMALGAFAIGLPAFVLTKVFSPGFFAREDTMTPMRFAAIGIAVNIAGSFALFFWIGHVGIALATSVAAWVNAGLLGVTLMKRGFYLPDARLKSRLPRLGVACLIMGASLWAGAHIASPYLGASFVEGVVALITLVVGGGALFAAAALFTGATHMKDLKRAFKRA
ncbi:MAG: murein biosynthesis integral membrane protein MurJ [Parvibaculum sp.]